MVEHFTGKPIQGNRAPVLSKLEFEGGARSRLAKPGEAMTLNLAAEDSNGDKVDFVTWILKSKVRKTTAASGPVVQSTAGKSSSMPRKLQATILSWSMPSITRAAAPPACFRSRWRHRPRRPALELRNHEMPFTHHSSSPGTPLEALPPRTGRSWTRPALISTRFRGLFHPGDRIRNRQGSGIRRHHSSPSLLRGDSHLPD